MKKTIYFVVVLLSITLFSSISAADSIMVHDAWIRSAPPTANVLAGYMNIMNKSDRTRLLISASSKSFGKVEMHKTEMHGDMMKMIPQDKLEIPAGGNLLLKPGGYHLMLRSPKTVLKEGEQVKLELVFDNGVMVTVNAPVRAAKVGGMMHHNH